MRRVLSTALTGSVPLLLASCSSTSATKDLGCVTDLGSAENDFNTTLDGSKAASTTSADDAKSMGDAKSKLADLALVTSVQAIKDKAAEASTLAGQIRVEISNGVGFQASSNVSPLRDALNALNAACTAAGK